MNKRICQYCGRDTANRRYAIECCDKRTGENEQLIRQQLLRRESVSRWWSSRLSVGFAMLSNEYEG